MKFSQFLEERYVNLFTKDSREKIKSEVWYMLHQTYGELGGLMGANIDDLVRTPGLWKTVKKGGKTVAGIIYRDTDFGRKIRLVFYDGTPEGKAALKKIIMEDVQRNRSWGEISGPLETCMLRLGAKMVDNRQVHKFLKVPESSIVKRHADGHHYDREVAPGVIKTQVLLGNLGS